MYYKQEQYKNDLTYVLLKITGFHKISLMSMYLKRSCIYDSIMNNR